MFGSTVDLSIEFVIPAQRFAYHEKYSLNSGDSILIYPLPGFSPGLLKL